MYSVLHTLKEKIDYFPEVGFDIFFEGGHGMGAAAAGAAQADFHVFPFDGNDFQIASVVLERFAEFFQYGTDFCFHDRCPFFSVHFSVRYNTTPLPGLQIFLQRKSGKESSSEIFYRVKRTTRERLKSGNSQIPFFSRVVT